MADRDFLVKLSQRLTDEGKLIEAGWIGLRLTAIPRDAPALQLEEMKNAFMAGAAHLFSSIMVILDPGVEPTEADLKRMSLIHEELEAFLDWYKRKHGLAEFDLRHRRPEGSA